MFPFQVESLDRAQLVGLAAIKRQADSTNAQVREDLANRVSHDLATGSTPASRDRPQDRVNIVDLDTDRSTVLERLLAARADAVNAEAAKLRSEAPANGDHEVSTADARLSLARKETPSPVVMRVPLPRAERASLITAVGGKDGLKRERVKPPPLGERDHNNPSRRLTTTRRVAKPSVPK